MAGPPGEKDEYLRLLGLEEMADASPSLGGLQSLVRAHVLRVPFENVSKLLLFAREGAGRPVRLREFLDGLEHADLGGTCYSSNPFFCELLQWLGYEATLLGADMHEPNVHTSIRVSLAGTAYHIDVGYAGPFTGPIPLDRLPYEIASGHDRYVLAASGRPDTYELSFFSRGVLRHGYVVHPPRRTPEFFRQTIVNSFEPGRTFMRCLRLSRYFDDRAVHLRNRLLIIARGSAVTEATLNSLEELRRAVDDEFQMPRCRIEDAVAVLERLRQRPFFGDEAWADSVD